MALPLVAPIVLSGFVMALPLSVPMLNWLGATAALICGAMLRVLEILCDLCSAVPGAYFPVSGVFALCTVVVVYILVFLGLKTRRLRAFSLAAAGMLALSLALSAALSAGTVQVVVAGRVTPSLVVVKNRQAVVLYRSRTSANAVAQVLWRHRVKECVLLVDMCQTVQSTEYVDLLKPREVVVGQDLLVGGQYTPLPGLDVVLVRQPGGDLACIDVEGYKVGCYTGSVDASPYARLNVLLAGSGTAAGEWDTLLCGSSVPGWAEAAGASGVLRSDGEASLWLRPGKSVIFREVLDGEGS